MNMIPAAVLAALPGSGGTGAPGDVLEGPRRILSAVTSAPPVALAALAGVGLLLMLLTSKNSGADVTTRTARPRWWPFRLLWRFATGAPMDGRPRTDATWTHNATRSVREDSRAATRWDHLPRGTRMAIRWAFLAVLFVILYAYTQDANTTGNALATLGTMAACAVGLWLGYVLTDRAVTWRHRRNWVWPLHLALYARLQLPRDASLRYLKVPPHFTEITGDMLRVELPADFTGEGKQDITNIITTKLALQDVSFSFKLDGRNHYLVARQTPRPPAKVLFADPAVRARVESAPESAPMIGLSHQDRAVSIDLDTESPHILVNAGTGGGKSVTLRAIVSQFLHNGAQATFLDRKRHSHKWAYDIPAVHYCKLLPEIHDALIALGEEGERRNLIVDEWRGDDRDAPVGPRHLIVFEEANATIGKLRRYWTQIRTKNDPKESPAIEALGDLMFMGRAVKMHVLMVAQYGTANSLGGPEMRENFTTRILARYSANAWRMLASDVPMPKRTRHTGRAQVILGDTPYETQVLFMTEKEAYEWAMSGAPAPAAFPASHVPAPRPHQDNKPGMVPEGSDGQPYLRVVRDPDDELVGIVEAVRSGVLMDLVREANERWPNASADELEKKVVENVRAARKADRPSNPFPEPRGNRGQEFLYRVGDLKNWQANRPKATKSKAANE
ncbi:hypothetical protein GCM10012275_64450 [Longimycelium tulufanense]|uniref:FtsK domain-containing protein n=2 Tax=Longimycelium tulufanense TaxID=907463 RepID=A0A8J3CKZ5_9PSEU|nr:hypothetical protein GCM10012275_64450 [Longimycelium tulufanense]